MSGSESWYEMTDQAFCKLNDLEGVENTVPNQDKPPISTTAKFSELASQDAFLSEEKENSTKKIALEIHSAQKESQNTDLVCPLSVSQATTEAKINSSSLQQTFKPYQKEIKSSETIISQPTTPLSEVVFSNVSTVETNSTQRSVISHTSATPPISVQSTDSLKNAIYASPIQTPMRGLTLEMLMKDGLIKTGRDVLTYENKGETIKGDLLEGLKVYCYKSRKTFPSLTGWMVSCRKNSFVSPLACSAECVKYKDRPLDAYKMAWFKKHQPFKQKSRKMSIGNEEKKEGQGEGGNEEEESKEEPCTPGMQWLQECAIQSNMMEEVSVMRLGRRCLQGQGNLLVECSNFSASRLQPFTVSITNSCLLVMHLHCHLITCEAIGYMGGKWDSTKQHLTITDSFPCDCLSTANKQTTDLVEYEVMTSMEKEDVSLVGWYHSHNRCQSNPSLRDVELQMEHQFQLKGLESSSFQPCFSYIISPFYVGSQSSAGASDSKLIYVHPPSEQRPLDYGTPMQVDHVIDDEDVIKESTLKRMRQTIEYWKEHKEEKEEVLKGDATKVESINSDYWVPGLFAPEEKGIFMQRLKQALVRFCPGRKVDKQVLQILSLIN